MTMPNHETDPADGPSATGYLGLIRRVIDEYPDVRADLSAETQHAIAHVVLARLNGYDIREVAPGSADLLLEFLTDIVVNLAELTQEANGSRDNESSKDARRRLLYAAEALAAKPEQARILIDLADRHADTEGA
jgi:hypothetical protein